MFFIFVFFFVDGYGVFVKFDEKGDVMGRYNIMNFQKNEKIGFYQYKVVGSWIDRLMIDIDKIVWVGKIREVLLLRCSCFCEFNEFKFVGKDGDICCWVCIKC